MKREGSNQQSSKLPQHKKQKLSHNVTPASCLELIPPTSSNWQVLSTEMWSSIAYELDNPRDLAAFEMTSKLFCAIAAHRWQTFADDFFPNVLPGFEKTPLTPSVYKKLLYSTWRCFKKPSLVIDDMVISWICPICQCLGNYNGLNQLDMDKWKDNSMITDQCEDCLMHYMHAFEWTFDTTGISACSQCPYHGSRHCSVCTTPFCTECGDNCSEGNPVACSCKEEFICEYCYKLCYHCDMGACPLHMKTCADCGLDKCPHCATKTSCVKD